MTDVDEVGEAPVTADASPEKKFFIYMLVKDIELLPAILDLVDNSVDAARARAADLEDPDDLSSFQIDIEARPSHFLITDNCGGLDLEKAETYAFRFGRPENAPGRPDAVGQFGVGMKRALFKLGKDFVVTSTSDRSRFVLPINVDAWLADPDPHWKFVFSDAERDYEPASDEVLGTAIRVNELHATVAEDFGSNLLQGRMRLDLEVRHQAALEAGLAVVLNDVSLRETRPELALSADVTPVHIEMDIQTDEGTVHLSLYAGIVKPDDDDEADDDDAEQFDFAPKAGWYLFCNDRLLLAADRSETTGWGDGATPTTLNIATFVDTPISREIRRCFPGIRRRPALTEIVACFA